jgi:Arc/MetJ-type ribon-helix-helix transcriptional regulator
MAKITVSVPQELHDKMKRHPEVRWSEVVRKAVTDYVARLEVVEGAVVPSEKLAAMLKDAGLDVSNIDLDKAVAYCEKAGRR